MIPLLYQLSYTGTAADDSATAAGCPDRPSRAGLPVVTRPPTILKALGELLVPRTCRLCLATPLFGLALCALCQRDLPRRSSICCRCLQVPGSPAPRCPGCHSRAPMRPMVHISSHEGALRKLILEAKIGHRDDLGQLLAVELSRTVDQTMCIKNIPQNSTVLGIPRSPMRHLGKGVPLSQRIAVSLGRSLGLDHQRWIGRRGSRPQTSLSSKNRRMLTEAAFFVRRSATRKNRTEKPPVILVDDVYTTGATLRAATGALQRAGYDVRMWVVASVARVSASATN